MKDLAKLFEAKGMEYQLSDFDNGKGVISAFSSDIENMSVDSEAREITFSLMVFPVSMDEDKYYRFSVVPFLENSTEYAYDLSQNVLMTLASWNHSFAEARFGVDEQGDIVLILDVLEERLDQTEFDRVIQILVDSAVMAYNDVEGAVDESFRYMKPSLEDVLPQEIEEDNEITEKGVNDQK
jgi:hypothetical protein